MDKSTPCVLGLDVSTSITGWSLLALESEDFSLGYLPLASSKDPYSKAGKVRELLQNLTHDHNICAVFVEQDLRRFTRGLSSAQTIATLARFNGVTCQIAFEETGIKPVLINVNEARKSVGIKYDRKDKTKTTKEKVFEIVQQKINYDWSTKILKSGPRKGLEVLEPGCYDAVDAWVIASAGKKLYLSNS
jgi:hypothetical protein